MTDWRCRGRWSAYLATSPWAIRPGPATARSLRNAGVSARLVGLTGTTLPEDLAACKQAGMETVLAKPLRPEDLLSALG